MKAPAIPLLRDLRLLDDDVLDRNVGVSPAAAGLYPLDSVDDGLALAGLAEHAVAPTLGAGRGVIQEVVVLEVDEELARGRMRLGGARHGYGIAVGLEAVAGLVLDGLLGWLLAHFRLEAAALDHESVDDAVKDRTVVEPPLHVLQEIRHRPRGPVGVALERDGIAVVLEAVAGLVLDGPLGWLLAHVGLEAAALDHESVDDAVKDRAVVEPALRVLQEIRHRLGGLVGVELEREGAHAGFEFDARILRPRKGRRNKQNEQGGQALHFLVHPLPS